MGFGGGGGGSFGLVGEKVSYIISETPYKFAPKVRPQDPSQACPQDDLKVPPEDALKVPSKLL